MDSVLKETAGILLRSYSQILFAEDLRLGGLLLVASFGNPLAGLTGLFGGVFSNFIAWALGLERSAIRRGLQGYNGVLIGLALGALFRPDARLFLVLALASILVVLLSAALTYALGQYFGLPALSLPFTLGAWICILATVQFGNLTPAPTNLPWAPSNWSALLPAQLHHLFTELSAVLFQQSAATGILLFAGVLAYSRISALTMIAGLYAAQLTHGFLGLKPSLLQNYSFALSTMFSGLALGAVLTIPSFRSLVFGMLGSLVSVLLLSACAAILPPYLPPFTLPYCITVLLGLTALRLRYHGGLGPALAIAPGTPPEQTLARLREQQRLQELPYIPIRLPFSGRWKVTQGVNGIHTHQGPWRFAYDFQAVDAADAVFAGQGLRLEDYLGYGKPILAPADGKVIHIENDIPDNPVGCVNLERNWGNHVILEHAPGWYSCLAHLKTHSVRVIPGQLVRRGQVIGQCGNSGRSAYPHLHLQFQNYGITGAASAEFIFSDILVSEENSEHYVKAAVLAEGSVVHSPPPLRDPHLYFPMQLDLRWRVRFRDRDECWSIRVDPLGTMCLESCGPEASMQARLRFRVVNGVIHILGAEGSRDSALHLLGSSIQEIPLLDTCGTELRWKNRTTRGLRPSFTAMFGLEQENISSCIQTLTPERLRLEIHTTHRMRLFGWHLPGARTHRLVLQARPGAVLDLLLKDRRVLTVLAREPASTPSTR